MWYGADMILKNFEGLRYASGGKLEFYHVKFPTNNFSGLRFRRDWLQMI